MRDLILLAALLGVIPLILQVPIVGLIAWIWITLMQPHREVYSFLAGAQLNLYIAGLTIIAWLASKERKVAPITPLPILLFAFAAWCCVTTYMAIDTDIAAPLLDRTLKSLLLAFFVVTIVGTRFRIQAVIWAIVISLGFYAIKGGGFVLLTGGTHRVYGPQDTMIGDNNVLGLALVMLLPLINYLRVTTEHRLVRLALLAMTGLTFIAVLGTQSRGALLALAAGLAVYVARSKSGLIVVAVAAVSLVALPHVLPQNWVARFASIETADQDTSFLQRVQAWRTSTNIALARPTGGGFSAVESNEVARTYVSPNSLKAGKAAHSIYFQVLGDHGFVGLAIFLMILGASLFNSSMALAKSRDRPDLWWARQLAVMMQVSIISYIVGGAALSMAYYDGVLIILALTAALYQVVRKPLQVDAVDSNVPNWRKVKVPQLEAGKYATGRDRG